MGFIAIAIVVALSLFSATSAFACNPIGVVPEWESPHSSIIIDQPGHYCLQQTLWVGPPDMNGITVIASGVVLDLGGSAIVGPRTGTGVGVKILGARDVVVNGGNVSGFLYGVWAVGVENAYLSRMDASGNIAGGLSIEGDGTVVEMSRVSGLLAAEANVADPFGISVTGANCHVRFNAIESSSALASSAIRVSAGSGCLIYNNSLRFFRQGESVGIRLRADNDASVHNNIIVGAASALVLSDGVEEYGNFIAP